MTRLSETELVWLAAAAAGTTPDDLLARTDMGALARVDAEADRRDPDGDGDLHHAARLLLAVVRERPFPDDANAAAGWLAAAFVLERAGVRVRSHRRTEVVTFVAGLDERTPLVDVVVGLERIASGGGRRLAWLCPACGRELYARERRDRRAVTVGVTAYELTARCWFEHRAHDRAGRPFPTTVALDPVGA